MHERGEFLFGTVLRCGFKNIGMLHVEELDGTLEIDGTFKKELKSLLCHYILDCNYRKNIFFSKFEMFNCVTILDCNYRSSDFYDMIFLLMAYIESKHFKHSPTQCILTIFYFHYIFFSCYYSTTLYYTQVQKTNTFCYFNLQLLARLPVRTAVCLPC